MSTSPQDVILEEERRWRSIAASILGEDAELMSVSRHIGDSRAYGRGDSVALIRASGSSVPRGVRGLEREAEILNRLGRRAEYRRLDDFEALILDRLPGDSLERLGANLRTADRLRILGATIAELRRLHGRGVAHRDLRVDNVLVDNGRVRLIDFDRADYGSSLRAAIADWIGIGWGGLSFYPFWKLALYVLIPKSETAASRVLAAIHGNGRALPDVPAGHEQLEALRHAWLRAQGSPANAPGQGLAYYAFTYRGYHFPGERPWYLRWEAIRRAVDFKGKHLVELGSNMGLLSTFACLHGAASARGVDGDAEIVESAKLVARALGAPAEFRQADLVADPGWEADLAGGDVVAAMSLLHWLPDPDRLLEFLRQHDEVIFEGHDPLDVETRRIKDLGFTSVTVIQRTERGRFVLHGRR